MSESTTSYSEARGVVEPADPAQPLEPDQSLGELLGRLSQDFGQLVTTQIELAKVEIKEEVTGAAKGAGLLGGGAVAALFGLLLLSHGLAWGLSEITDAGFAFLIVGLLWVVVAAILALLGRRKIQQATPVVPQIKRDAEGGRGVGQTAEELRSQAEAQRADISRDLEAIGDRVSPGRMVERRRAAIGQSFSRARDVVMGRPDAVRGQTGTTLSNVGTTVGDVASNVGQRIGDVPGAVREQTEGNPLAAGLIAFGAGMLLATVIPATRREEEAARRIEPQLSGVADEVKAGVHQVAAQMKPAAREAVEDVKSSARDAVETVKDEAASGAQQVKDEAGNAADNVRQQASSSPDTASETPPATTPPAPVTEWTPGETATDQTAYPPA